MRHLHCALLIAGLGISPVAALPDAPGHWALQPVTDPAPAKVADVAWPRQQLDSYVLAKLEAADLKPAAEADRAMLARRLYFDLTGLPPTFEEIQAFERDASPDAYEKLVGRLLASDDFGERWARHWLDIARYSDTKGYVFEESRDYPYAYSFRDWTIGAFNDDLPYDQFLLYQIAADKAAIADADKHHLAAMGFLTVGRRFLNNQHDIIDDRIDVTFRGALGLTVACARCHDHKYDPIAIDDYYSLYGVFASSEEPKELPLLGPAPETAAYREFEQALAAKQKTIDDYLAMRATEQRSAGQIAKYLIAAHQRWDASDQDLKKLASERKLLHKLAIDWRRYLKGTDKGGKDPVFAPWHRFARLPSDQFPAKAAALWNEIKRDGTVVHPKLREKLDGVELKQLETVATAYGEILSNAGEDSELKQAVASSLVEPGRIYRLLETPGQQHVRKLRRKLESVKTKHHGAPPRGMVVVDRASPAEPHIFQRGDPHRRGAKVPRQFLEMLKGSDRKPFSDGSGRLEMAREITSNDNPLTARVWVNRVWGHLLGSHIVNTPSDFGLRSEAPTHPLMLDHLARRFMDEGWSTKKLIRRIVLSSTYRQSSNSKLPAAQAEIDPENRLFGRANRRRLGFEAMRDGMLAVSDQLDRTRLGRPVDISGDNYSKRRTIYGRVERQNLPPVFRTFDFASPDVHTPKRPETTVPQQALFMMNGKFAADLAEALAEHPQIKKAMKPADRVRFLYRQIFSREPDAEEIADALAFVTAEQLPSEPGSWEYGRGKFDEASGGLTFTPLEHFTGDRWQVGESLPDPKLGWVSLHKHGGHPGSADHAVIWRWVVPQDGRYAIKGSVEVPSPNSSGVGVSVFAGEGRRLGKWEVTPETPTPIHVGETPLRRGDAVHFVVDCGRGNEHSDSFTWNPGIRDLSTGQTWVASEAFSSRNAKPTDALWQQLAQALLASNEFAFVD